MKMVTKNSIYSDIAKRTGGDIYIGVVGPVRTGKSTFIKRVMETLVLPGIENEYDKKRAEDEMPQSAGGKTVMTTEPKFIPDEAVKISVDGVASLSVKMVDCVGYVVPAALGQIEEGKPRMVLTPWSDEPMPFDKAAEVGTRKVINDHSTIGILVTSDGSVCDIPREEYLEAERMAVEELKSINKPFAIVLNSREPESERAEKLALELEEIYSVPVALVSCLDLGADDIRGILELVLGEVPISDIDFNIPEWVSMLDESHPLTLEIKEYIRSFSLGLTKIGEIVPAARAAVKKEFIEGVNVESIDLGIGRAVASPVFREGLYFEIISELCKMKIESEKDLVKTLSALSEMKNRYEKIEKALEDADNMGYGIVIPKVRDMKLEEPKIVRHSGGYGVRLKASAPSLHIIKATIETEIDPVVGSEQQSEELLKFLLSEFEDDPSKIWDTNLFGKTLHELASEGLNSKLENMPPEAREKISETLARIVNEGSGGLICIIL